MSLDVSKLSMEQVKQLYSEGKLTAQDIAKLSPKEQEELASIAGEQAVLTGDELTKTGATQGKNIDKSGVTQKDEDAPAWKKWLGVGAASLLGAGAFALTKGKIKVSPNMLKALDIGGVATKGKISPKILKALGLGGVAATGMMFASCENFGNNVSQTAGVGITFIVTKNDSNEKIIEAIKELGVQVTSSIASCYQQLVSIGITSHEDASRVYTLLQALGFQNSDIYDLLIQQGGQADQIIKLLGDNNELLNSIKNFNAEITDMLKRIYDAVKQANELGQNNNDILTQILAKLETLGDNDDIKALLQQILDKVTQGVEQNKEMDTQTHDLLNQILSMLGNMDETSKSFFTQIMDKLDSLGDSNKAALAQILKAINTNTKVAQQTQVLVMEILNNLTKLGNKSDEILNLLAEISSNTASLDDIKDMLKDLLAQSKKNGEVLTDIDSKLSLISVTLNRLLTVVQSLGKGHEQLLAKLNEILAKIPDGCNCGNIDLTVIINKLDQLIEAVKNNPNDDKNHEGILEDLDDLLG